MPWTFPVILKELKASCSAAHWHAFQKTANVFATLLDRIISGKNKQFKMLDINLCWKSKVMRNMMMR